VIKCDELEAKNDKLYHGHMVSWNLMNISLMMTKKPSLCKSQIIQVP